MAATERTVHARWLGGLKASVDAGGFPVVADEPESVGGGGTAPQPTELLLASIASCFTIALAHCAARRGTDLAGLQVDVTGHYDGPRFSAFRIDVHTDTPRGEELAGLIAAAERVCYVSRTLRSSPRIDIVAHGSG